MEHAATPSAFRIGPFPGDQLSMPPQNRIGRDDRGHLTQPSPAQAVAAYGQSAAFIIGQPQAPATQLPAETRFSAKRYAQASCCRWFSQPASAARSIRTEARSTTVGVYITD